VREPGIGPSVEAATETRRGRHRRGRPGRADGPGSVQLLPIVGSSASAVAPAGQLPRVPCPHETVTAAGWASPGTVGGLGRPLAGMSLLVIQASALRRGIGRAIERASVVVKARDPRVAVGPRRSATPGPDGRGGRFLESRTCTRSCRS
jgi:hypothetical protein